MTNGRGAVFAEIVENPLPNDRVRAEIHRHPLYYVVHNRIIEFLVSRSRTFVETVPDFNPPPRGQGTSRVHRSISVPRIFLRERRRSKKPDPVRMRPPKQGTRLSMRSRRLRPIQRKQRRLNFDDLWPDRVLGTP
jgi:hypothetical protein